ncbi:hypothetical protein BH11CYA1_BH11CYA1_01340 [soil metagenome]
MTKNRLNLSINALNIICLLVNLPALAVPEKAKETHGPQENIGLQEHPAAWSDAIPYYNLANKYLEKARYEDAIDNYHEAIARYSDDPDFYINLGYCYRKLEDFESAEQAFRKAISLNNKDWVTWSNLANALLKQNKLPETVSTFEKCLKLTMPAKEREAINRDIADIKKILAMRKPDIKPEIVSGKGALPKTLTSGTPAAKNSAAKIVIEKIPPNKVAKPSVVPRLPADNTAKREKTEATGWDYVYK